MAFVIAVTGACEAAGQTVKENDLPPIGNAKESSAARNDVERREVARSPRPAAPSRENDARDARAAERRIRTDAGLRNGYWAGTPYSLLAETLPRLPVQIASPIIRSLTFEVLTAPADPVQGSVFATRLTAIRAERLYAMGQIEAADVAFRSAPPPAGDPGRAPAEIETKLLLHGPRAACEAVRRHLAAGSTSYLERASIACHAMAGEHATAALGLGRLRERGTALGVAFAGLVTSQQPDLARPLAALGAADAWTVRLLAATSLRWPEDAARLSPALLRVVAGSANGPDAVRIAAAERAFILGAVDRLALVALYRSVRFREAALRQAGRLDLAHYSPLKRALLFQAAMRARDRRLQMEILANWWRLARAERNEALASLVTAPIVLDLLPGAEWRENAPAISRVFFHAGELERALAWYAWIRNATFKDMEAYTRLSALAQLAERNGRGWAAVEARAWADYQRDRSGDDGERRIVLLRELEAGLGPPGSRKGTEVADAWGRTLNDDLAEWRNAHAAARAGRRGEAILLMLTALGHDGVARAEPRALGAAVGVLAALGRDVEARRLAVEAALSNGF